MTSNAGYSGYSGYAGYCCDCGTRGIVTSVRLTLTASGMPGRAGRFDPIVAQIVLQDSQYCVLAGAAHGV